MIKTLFLIATLLVPSLAYAGNPSAPFSDQVVSAQPSGSPPTAPAPAQAAGFTTCVVCMDFTAPSGGVWVNGAAVSGVNAAQTNTWLDCAGASSPIWQFVMNLGAARGPCPHIVTDTSVGKQVLEQNLGTTSIPGSTFYGNGMALGINWPTTYLKVPTDLYFEMTYKLPSVPSCSGCNDAYSQGHWLGEYNNCPRNTAGACNFLEFDANEINFGTNVNTNGYASGGNNWDPTYTCCVWVNWEGTPSWTSTYNIQTQYVTVGMRTTSDGTTLYKCMWVQNVTQNCVSAAVGTSNISSWEFSDASSRMLALVSLASVDNTNESSAATLSSDMIGYIQSINMWSCSGWQTTACHTSNPNP